MNFQAATHADAQALAELRATSMKESLVAIGRYDESRVRERFLQSFTPEDTTKIIVDETLAGFFVVRLKADHIYLDHLYITPRFQGQQLGAGALNKVFAIAQSKKLPVRLGALKESKANEFYQRHGLKQTHKDEFDIYYEKSF